MDKLGRYVIVGIHKCGTTSLEKWLNSHGHDVIRKESIFWDGGVNRYIREYPHYQPIFILRDPIERTWSHFWYKKNHQKGDRRQIFYGFGPSVTRHPEMLDHSRYSKWIIPFLKVNPLVLQLETLQKYVADFPKENASPDKPKLTNKQRNDIGKLI